MYGGCVLSDHAGLLNFTIITYTIKKAKKKKTFEYLHVHTNYIQLLKFYNKWHSDKKEERKKTIR